MSTTVSTTNGTTRTEFTTEAEAAEFVRRYGVQNIAAEMAALGLDPQDYDSELAMLTAWSDALPAGEVLTLP